MDKIRDADGIIVYSKNVRIVLLMLVLFPIGSAINHYVQGPWIAYVILALLSLVGLLVGGYTERLEVDSIRGQVTYAKAFLMNPLHNESFPFAQVLRVVLYPDTQPVGTARYQLSLEWRSQSGTGFANLSQFDDEAQAKNEANRLASVLSTQVAREP